MCLRNGLFGRGWGPVSTIVTVSPRQGHTPRPEVAWSMHDASAWNGIKSGDGHLVLANSSWMLMLNKTEEEMAAANARVNELVALQVEMMLKGS